MKCPTHCPICHKPLKDMPHAWRGPKNLWGKLAFHLLNHAVGASCPCGFDGGTTLGYHAEVAHLQAQKDLAGHLGVK
jgi:hypothetical protein